MNTFNIHLSRRRFLTRSAVAAGLPLWYFDELAQPRRPAHAARRQ